ncbi:phage tail protein [Paenibacillus cellulositrophicus]|uniref:phage tail protein n=1 Tax=Paenibacillus TaxID=44249 RepID=UPI0013D490C5|nr:tail fiber protein [Paenibacillus favisporus]
MSEAYTGEIRLFAGNYAPTNWAFCNGQILSISEYEILYSLIGTIYGGDGTTTFALPDFRGRIVLNQGRSTTGTNYVLSQTGGTETVTLTASQLPAHTHGVNVSSDLGTDGDPTNSFWAQSPISQYSNSEQSPASRMNAGNITSNGGNQPHANMMPTLAISYIICLNGLYPTRD